MIVYWLINQHPTDKHGLPQMIRAEYRWPPYDGII